MYFKSFIIVIGLYTTCIFAHAQNNDSLLRLIVSKQIQKPATGSIRLANGHTPFTLNKAELGIVISHRFGSLKGANFGNLFGLDEYANIRLGVEYGLFDRLTVGFGRSRVNRLYDFYGKGLIVMQKKNGSPFSITTFNNLSINTSPFSDAQKEYLVFKHRVRYMSQLIIARDFNSKILLQVMPTFIHRNLAELAVENNNHLVIGIGGRWQFLPKLALVAEYYGTLNKVQDISMEKFDIFCVGLDISSSRNHAFQLQFTNALSMVGQEYQIDTTENFFAGDIRFGFHISRVFGL